MQTRMSLVTQRFFAGKQLVVFGAGYIGGEVVRRALANRARVTALTHNPAMARELRIAGAQVIEADLAGSEWHAGMPARVDLVLNSVGSGPGGPAGYRHSYVEGMRSILGWAQTAQVQTMVYTGSTSVYPQGDGALVTEDSPVGGCGETAQLLIETEDLLRTHGAIGRWFILRLAGLYGPGRHFLLDQVRARQPLPGTGTHRLNLVHRDDVCTAIEMALGVVDGVASEIFNVVDDTPATKEEVVRWLAAAAGVPPPRFDPTQRSRRGAVPDRRISNARIKKLLGWRPEYADYRSGYRQILAAL